MNGAIVFIFFVQAEDGIRDVAVTGVQTCALPICRHPGTSRGPCARGPRPRTGRGGAARLTPPASSAHARIASGTTTTKTTTTTIEPLCANPTGGGATTETTRAALVAMDL